MPDILELDVDSRWLARQLRESGRTQAELARYLGLTAPQINKTLKGRRKIQASEADLIREFFGAAPPPQVSAMRPSQVQLVDSNVTSPLRSEPSRSLPIYGSVSVGGRQLTMKKPVDYARRPRRLDGRDDVFALYVDDELMSPVFEPGELIALESARPPAPGDNVVVHLKSDETLLRRLVAIDASKIQLRQHNPPDSLDIARADIESMWRVMKVNDLLTG